MAGARLLELEADPAVAVEREQGVQQPGVCDAEPRRLTCRFFRFSCQDSSLRTISASTSASR